MVHTFRFLNWPYLQREQDGTNKRYKEEEGGGRGERGGETEPSLHTSLDLLK